jgi:phosphonate transport system substrate-binding protein
MKVFDGSNGNDGVLLVPESSATSAAIDLRGKRICYSDTESTTGYLLPRAWLRRQGLDPDRDLTSHMSGNHFQVLRDLDAGLCDVGGTFGGAYLAADNAGVSVSRMRVLAITGRTPHDAVCAGPAADPATTARFQSALLALDPPSDIGTSRIGDSERITGFAAADDHLYDDVRAAVALERGDGD